LALAEGEITVAPFFRVDYLEKTTFICWNIV